MLFLILLSHQVIAQLFPCNSWPAPGPNDICALGYDKVQHRVWIYHCNADSLICLDTTGQKLVALKAPGEIADDSDIDIAPVSFQLAGTMIPQGTLLIINGETDSAEIYAMDPVTGIVLDTLFTSFGNNHVQGGAYHIPSGTIFLVQDGAAGLTLGDRVAEINVNTGQVIQTWSFGNLYSVYNGDLEAAENGNLYIVSSYEDSILEITPQGQFVQRHDINFSIGSISGFDFDCATGSIWACNTVGNVYHFIHSNCNSATGISTADNSPQVFTVYPNPSEGIFRFDRELEEFMVFDILGNEVLRKTEKSRQLDMHAFSDGIYLLRTSGGVTARLIKFNWQ